MHTLSAIFFIILGLLFGNWKRWNEYYPTLLFWVIGNLLYETLLEDYRVWELAPVGIDHIFLPTHIMISLSVAFVIYPFAITVFIGRMPKSSLFKKVCWCVYWALLFTCVEYISLLNHGIEYHHGWSLIWTFLFDLMTFSLLLIHNWKHWVAWGITALWIGLLCMIFQPVIPN